MAAVAVVAGEPVGHLGPSDTLGGLSADSLNGVGATADSVDYYMSPHGYTVLDCMADKLQLVVETSMSIAPTSTRFIEATSGLKGWRQPVQSPGATESRALTSAALAMAPPYK